MQTTLNTKDTHRQKILKLLKENRHVTNIQLNRIAYRYSARIHELREDDFVIEREYLKPGVYRYWLVREPMENDSF